jgi:hypothetical protein
MKNPKSNEPKNRKYFQAFICVTALNILLAGFLLNSFGQTSRKDTQNQTPLKVEVAAQEDGPLRITLINVDNSPSWYQAISYAVQNTSNKPVRGYVVSANGKHTGKIVTSFFPITLFQARDAHQDEMALERENIRPGEALLLSVDYVEFEDGNSWGPNTQKQSDQIAGGRAGVESARLYFNELIAKRDMAVLTSLLEKNLVDVEVPFPDEVPSEQWKIGFEQGFKSVVYFFKGKRSKDPRALSKYLDEIMTPLSLERKQGQ